MATPTALKDASRASNLTHKYRSMIDCVEDQCQGVKEDPLCAHLLMQAEALQAQIRGLDEALARRIDALANEADGVS